MNTSKFRELLKKYASGTARRDEEKAVDAFFDAMQLERTDTENVKHDLALQNRILDGIKRNIHREKYRAGLFRLAAAVTSILMVAGLAFYRHTRTSGIEKDIVVMAARGEQVTITLPDSSKVHLNSGSELSYPRIFTASTRHVTLRGEAYFDVTHDDEKPFIVSSGVFTTQVLGTRFSVTAYADVPPAVTVVSGKVNVTSRDRSVYLTANEQATADLSGSGLTRHQVNAGDYVSWTTGKIFFDHANIRDVIAILNKRFKTDLCLQSEAYESCTISGNFSATMLDNVLESIAFINDMKYARDHDGQAINIYVKPCPTVN